MQAKIICMASAKGGSGKTSLAATFGSFLSKLQKKVLLIDADPATNGLTLLYIKEVKRKADFIMSFDNMSSDSRTPLGLYAGIEAGHCDVVELSENLHIIPIDYTLRYQNLTLCETTRPSFHRLLGALRSKYDFILIDAQAGADEAAQVAMSREVSDEVIIVSEYDPMSAAGVERLKAILHEDLLYDRTWVLLNKILPEFARSFGDFLEFAKYLNPIPWSAEVVRAYARRQLAIDADTGTEHTLSVIQTLKGLVGDAIQNELKEWVQSRAAMIRQPMEQQYRDAEKELEQLLKTKKSLLERYARQFVLLLIAYGAVVFVLIGPSVLPSVFSVFFSRTDVVAITGGLVGILYLGYRLVYGDKGVEEQVKEARVNRQRALLENKLKRLEVLRALDAESLLQEQRILRDREWTDLRSEGRDE